MSSTLGAGQQIFVQLGRLPHFGSQYIQQARAANPSIRTVLVTDHRVTLPGIDVVAVNDVVRSEEFARLTSQLASSPFDPRWRRGYWLRVFGRFLVLRNYCRVQGTQAPTLHLECDVASTVTMSLLESTLDNLTAPTGVPFIDPATACPGIVVARTASDLAALSDYVVRGVADCTELSDMQSLAIASSTGMTDPLPTRVGRGTTTVPVRTFDAQGSLGAVETAEVVFDAAAVGQYLFGIDPRNNRGVLIPGYREVRGDLDPGLWTDWCLSTGEDGITRVAFREDGRLGVLATLHVHAKIALPPPNDVRWNVWLSIANNQVGARPTVMKGELARYEVQEGIRRTRRGLRRLQQRVIGRRSS